VGGDDIVLLGGGDRNREKGATTDGFLPLSKLCFGRS